MRLGKLLGGVAVAALVFGGAASPALAKKEKVEGEFEATVGGKITNAARGTQQFKFGPFKKLVCLGATSTGEAAMGLSKAVTEKIKWEGCSNGKGKGKSEARFTPWEVEFHSNGTFAILNEPKITLPAVSCVIDIQSGEIGEAELGKRNPLTFATVTPKKEEVAGRKVEVKAKVKVHEEEGGIGWEFNEKKECGKLEEIEGEDGVWKGSLLDEAVKGELAFT